jgi:NAD(P)-dependent dehydrogenase (short-subunit alcohol dehydrogenase family)
MAIDHGHGYRRPAAHDHSGGRSGRWPWSGAALAGAGLALGLVAKEALARAGGADLRGEVALVTGGSRGLGLALARELAGKGCKLAICARDEAELARAAADLEARGAEVVAIPCNLRDEGAVRDMVLAVTARYGRIDLLVNNAGIILVEPVEAATSDDFADAMATDFFGALYPTLAVLPQMRERRGGRIVTITSVGGKVSLPHMLPYTAAKFAAVGFSEGLRAELAGDGIAVTTVVPGEMKTGSFLHAEFGGDREAEYRWFALGASAPFTISADRAARRIVRAIERGTAELTFPISAVLLSRLNGIAPGVTSSALALVDKALPGAPAIPPAPVPGAAIDAAIDAPVFDAATALGRAAAADLNQTSG